MTALFIIIGSFVVLLLLLLAPVSVCFDYGGNGAKLFARYLFFRFRILPAPVTVEGEKKRKMGWRQKKKAVKEEKRKKISSYIDTVKMVFDLLNESRWSIRLIRRGIIFSRFKLLASIGGEDAHQTAENYGRAAAVLFPVLSFFSCIFIIKKPTIYIAPNFHSGKTVVEASVRARIMPITALIAAVNIVIKLIISPRKNMTDKMKSKGGKKHERTSSPR